MTQPLGTFSLVLHSHIPYVLAHGRSPHGTDWLSEAAAETYLPLLGVCHKLIAEGISPKITLGLTPVLVEQLRDPSFQDELSHYLRGKIEAAQANQEQFRRDGNYHMAYLARYWEDWYGKGLTDFEDVYGQDIVGAFKALQDAGHIEIITSSATHGYSALLSQDTSIQAQVKTGIDAYERHFGRKPRGYWLPECAYRPRYHWSPSVAVPNVSRTPVLRKGTDEFLSENGIEYFFVEGSLLHGGEALGVYADKFGPLQALYKQFQKETVKVEYRPYTTYRPYLVDSSGQPDHPKVAVFGRDSATGKQVWSGDHGYPGDQWYLEFHKKFVRAGEKSLGLRYWRISPDKADIDAKSLYEPLQAEERAQAHAAHFAPLVKEVLTTQNDPKSIITAVYDTELFGHWWFEGPQFLYHALKQIAQDPEITLQTTGEYLDSNPATLPVTLPEGSWGEGGFHYIWLNEQTAWSWKLVYEVEAEMSELARLYSGNAAAAPILKQAAREALLLMASDWQFCISTGGAKDYSEVRLRNHYDNFQALANLTRRAASGETLSVGDWKNIAECEARDSIFPYIDPKWFARVEEPAE
ncbi:MAG: glycoside hydrolase family 57 protein [Janthinobacterium lividum]